MTLDGSDISNTHLDGATMIFRLIVTSASTEFGLLSTQTAILGTALEFRFQLPCTYLLYDKATFCGSQ
jgi:hypothetical protein